ncbi:PIN-like domain-containing protein [Nocardia fluminea]|uniref:PIN-like domain-containing protein n=1 Tax=Nocardia fluminea TaxID=134984 RepID=UPI00364D3315
MELINCSEGGVVQRHPNWFPSLPDHHMIGSKSRTDGRLQPLMRSVLSHWYGPDDEELAEFYKDGTIALDANILLSLYRVNGDQRAQIIQVLEKVADRIWIPYQVALEYQRNRLKVASGVNKAFDAIEAIPEGSLSKIREDACRALQDLSKTVEEKVRDREIRKRIQAEFEKTQEGLTEYLQQRKVEMAKEFNSIRKNHTLDFDDVQNGDPVRAALDRILKAGNVGDPPNAETLEVRRTEAGRRIENDIPPGYEDAGDKDDPAGDYLIWFELLDHAKSSERRVLFVTDDVKDDFYRRIYGRTIGPRIELIEEMQSESGQRYHQTTLDAFLRSANKFLNTEVKEETITTVKSARESIRGAWVTSASPSRASEVEYELLRILLIDNGGDVAESRAKKIDSELFDRLKRTAIDKNDFDLYHRINKLELSRDLNGDPDMSAQVDRDVRKRNTIRRALSKYRRAHSEAVHAGDISQRQRWGVRIAESLLEMGNKDEAREFIFDEVENFRVKGSDAAPEYPDSSAYRYMDDLRGLYLRSLAEPASGNGGVTHEQP